MPQQVALIILDGWGYREDSQDNAIADAKTPFFDSLWQKYPHSLLQASGEYVGLPEGQIGNSEIGHTTIGAGKVIDTDLVKISKSIKDQNFAKTPAFLTLFDHVLNNNSTLHVMGLLSEGGIHSHQDHLHAFLKAAKEAGISKIAIHAFTDGRDVGPTTGAEYLKQLEELLEDLGIGFIATVSGRFYAMDRDNNWDRLAKVEELLFNEQTETLNKKASDVLKELYAEGKIDEHIVPMVFSDNDGKTYPIQENDGVFCFNYRSDRAKMLSTKILERVEKDNLVYVSLTEYDPSYKCLVAFPPSIIETTLAEQISLANLSQAHIAETEKFPHATYFLNGGRQDPYQNEEHIMLESRKDVPTHDLAPKMRAEGIADKAIEQIAAGKDFIFINFANPDMVGHTANKQAIIEALEEVDLQLSRVVEALVAKGGIAVVTADHGNAEVNIDPQTKEKHTAHTLNPVPVIITKEDISLKEGTLADLAPTVLELFELEKPASMTGQSLLN